MCASQLSCVFARICVKSLVTEKLAHPVLPRSLISRYIRALAVLLSITTKKTCIRVPFWWKRKWNMFTYSVCCSTVICLFFHAENCACFGPVVPQQCLDRWSELMAIFCQWNFAKKIRKSNLINLSELVQVRFLMIEKDQSLYNTVI